MTGLLPAGVPDARNAGDAFPVAGEKTAPASGIREFARAHGLSTIARYAMTMITRCPACSTLFKVVPDQLRIADGWVRCGQCLMAFDARSHMQTADPDAPPFGPSAMAADTGAQTIGNGNPAAGAFPVNDGVTPSMPGFQFEAPVDEVPAFSTPAFEPKTASRPDSAPVPVFSGAPVRAAEPKAPAPEQEQAADKTAAPTSSLHILAREDLDRRHAKLMEALVRLRENADRNADRQDKDAGPRDMPSPGGGDQASREARRHDPLAERDRPRGQEDRLRESVRSGAHGQRNERDQRDPRGQDGRVAARGARDAREGREGRERRDRNDGQSARPMIDFVLSEIGRALPPAPSASSRAASRAALDSEPAPLEEDVPAFVEQARRRAFWALPRVRAVLWGVAALMTALFVAQIAASQRDRLAAQFPGAAPLLAALCRPMHCQIAPWRHLDAVVIDSSNFMRAGPDSFNVAVTLRNGGGAPVATPALELTLTDALDQPLVRRVLAPADWGAPPQLAAHGEFSGAALLTARDAAHPQAISGYRLTAFYP